MPPKATRNPRRLRISGQELVAAAYLSGQPGHLLSSSWGSQAAFAFRTWRSWAALGLLEPHGQDNVMRTKEYEELDPTEKSHMNYVLGGTLAKAYAASKLGVPWLAHLSLAQRFGAQIQFHSGNKRRPDYLGYANNFVDLVIAEAKGRQRPDSRLKGDLDGKGQTSAVQHVDGAVPVKRYGILAEARLGNPVSLYAVEPPEVVKIDWGPLQWIRAYYDFAQKLADECADDPIPEKSPQWAGMDLRVPRAIREWLKHERDLDAWQDVKKEVKEEVYVLGRRGAVKILPDLLIARSRNDAHN